MANVVDTIPTFEKYARKASLESPLRRDLMWQEQYERVHREVFSGFGSYASPGGRQAVVKELSRVRERVEEAAPQMRQIIEDVDPRVPEAIGVQTDGAPVHVLMVGHFTTNSAVGRMDGDVAVFHCLEWFQSAEGARVLVAHETTHAWHELAHGSPFPDDDLAWTAFYEGLATQASRAIVPGRPELDYFWYGHPEVEDWLPWCEEHRDELIKHFRVSLDIPEANETFFGGGLVDGKWRVGFYVADHLVRGLGRSLPELAAMSVDDARSAIHDALNDA